MFAVDISVPGVGFDEQAKLAVPALAIAESPETEMLSDVVQVSATMAVVLETVNATGSTADMPETAMAVEFEFEMEIVTEATNLTVTVTVAFAAATPVLSSIQLAPVIPNLPNF